MVSAEKRFYCDFCRFLTKKKFFLVKNKKLGTEKKNRNKTVIFQEEVQKFLSFFLV